MIDWIQKLPTDIRDFIVQLSGLPNFPELLAKFAYVNRGQKHGEEGLYRYLARHAWEMAPHNPKVRHAVEWAIRKSVPNWHFSIVHDQGRNDVYERALRHFVTPDTVVLEIGAGTGILAMMAANAGARHVYTCEMEPLVVQAALENIARNGYAERVTVIPKKSTDLIVGEDIPAQADLLVSEIVDNSLLGEDVLPIMEDAHTRLLQPGALILPEQVAVRGALVGGPPWAEKCRLGKISGFDLSAFNRLAPPLVSSKVDGHSLDKALSDDVELFRFDFSVPAQYPAEQKEISLTARRDGLADGFLHWIWLGFTDDIHYNNRPPAQTAWSPLLHVFPEPLALQANDTVHLIVEHDRTAIMVSPKDKSILNIR